LRPRATHGANKNEQCTYGVLRRFDHCATARCLRTSSHNLFSAVAIEARLSSFLNPPWLILAFTPALGVRVLIVEKKFPVFELHVISAS
jgi:hypothetical protein